jgi:hypothetical protein
MRTQANTFNLDWFLPREQSNLGWLVNAGVMGVVCKLINQLINQVYCGAPPPPPPQVAQPHHSHCLALVHLTLDTSPRGGRAELRGVTGCSNDRRTGWLQPW